MISKYSQEYDLTVLGATGYTGKLCVEYIATSLPTNLRWAVAGRSESKLLALIEELKAIHPDRKQPGKLSYWGPPCVILIAVTGVEITSLSLKDLGQLTRKTRVLINTIGPYHLYSTPVVEACATNGTHYLDVTGESPWVLEMIRKYHETAKVNHAIIIPEIAIESAPSDLLTFALAKIIREKLSVGTKEVIGCVHEVKGAPSGGTLATVLGLLDHYSLKEVAESSGTWASSPVPGPKDIASPSLLSKLIGIRYVEGLGTLTTSVSAGPNVATVQRSWGLLDGGKLYGPRFSYHEYAAVRNAFIGIIIHFVVIFGALALALAPVRWLLRKVLYAPGQGATREAANNDSIEYRAVATADQDGPNPQRAIGKMRWDGGNYYFTGVCLAEAAMVILNEGELMERLDGGILTPAMLGQPFIDRMTKAGMAFEVEMMP